MAFRRIVSIVAVLALVHRATSTCREVRKCLSALDKGEDCPLLPVPKSSLGTPSSPEGFTITKLRPGVYSWSDTAYTSLILYKKQHLVLMDFPAASTAFRDGSYLLIEAVKRIVGVTKPIRIDMIYGHRHFDHIGGADIFFEFVQERYSSAESFVWGTEETRSFIAHNQNTKMPFINKTVTENNQNAVHITGGLKVELIVLAGHTQSDLAAHIPLSKEGPGVIHVADFVTPGFAPFLDFANTFHLEQYITAQEEVLKLPFKILSGGHGKLGTPEDLRVNIKYSKDVIKFIGEASQEVTQEDLLAAGVGGVNDRSTPQFGNSGFALKVTLDLNAAICARKLIKKYGCKLGSVDLFAHSHCKEAYFFFIVDSE